MLIGLKFQSIRRLLFSQILKNNKMKNLIIICCSIILSNFLNPSFGQNETSFDLECLETPYHIDYVYHDQRIYCENGATFIDTLNDPCKDLYYQDGFSLWTLLYVHSNNSPNLGVCDEVNIVEEEFLGEETKVIEMKESLIWVRVPDGESVNSVSFDLIDLNNEGINFIYNYGGWNGTYYDTIDDMLADNPNMSKVGNRIHVQDSITQFHIGGNHIKVANIVFNETIENTTATNDISNIDVEIFPNPTADLVNINCKSTVISSVNIFDSQGKSVFRKDETVTSHQINLANWASGIYWIELKTASDERYFHKIVKQ